MTCRPFRSFAATLGLAACVLGPAAAPAEVLFAPPGQPELTPSLAPMIEAVLPGVVSIAVMGTRPAVDNPLFSDPFFRPFFDQPENGAPPDEVFQAAGSGVVVDAEAGLILTNAHVVADAQRITVRLSDGREMPATVLGSDPATDVAALSVEPTDLRGLVVGRLEDLRVGDYVVAVGNPFGLEHTVTSGIVSALGRANLGIEGYENFIQVDAAVNPGNSGGALVNLRGELVGINTAILGPGGNIGIGFAIPIDMAMQVAGQLRETGTVERGQIGIMIQDLTPALARALGLGNRQGVLVSDVLPGTSAEAAGLMPGDVIVAIDGRTLRRASELRSIVGVMKVGSELRLDLIRDGAEMTVTLRIGAAGSETGEPPQAETAATSPGGALSGVTLRAVETGGGRSGEQPGVLVETVDPASDAAAADLRPGDVITAVNRESVATPQDVARLVHEASDEPLLLRVFRDGRALFIVVG